MPRATSIGFVSLFIMLALVFPAGAIEEIPDGSFENFDDTWQCDLNCIQPALDYFVYPSDNAVDGYTYAYLFHDAGIYQDLTVPPTAATLEFAYDNQLDGEEEGSFTVSLSDPETGDVFVEQAYAEQSDEWIVGTLDIPESVQGQVARLLFSNDAGFNRIDALQFTEVVSETSPYATAIVRVLSAAQKPVKGASVFVKYHGVKVSLLNAVTNETVTAVLSNKKGRTPKFTMVQEFVEDETAKLCVKKKKIKECTEFPPQVGVETTYDFSFTNKKVK